MQLEYIPLLEKQHELYKVPLGQERFQAYLKVVIGDASGHDLELAPLAWVNPMAKDHALRQVQTLLDLGAEETAKQAMEEARGRLDIQGFKVSTVLLDDLKGGWTNRYLNEARDYFKPLESLKKFLWIIVPCWTADKPSLESIRQTMMTYIYRASYVLEHGNPTTLIDVLRQEGLAMQFAGANQWLDGEDLEYSKEVIKPFLQSEHYPTQFVCLFGDEAAKAVGYPPLGLSARAGLAVALASVKN
jgi:uncharacterized protein YjaZ